MAALRTYWDPPYRSHYQRLGQPRQAPWDLPGQRRSRGVRTYDQPQPPYLRGMPSGLEMPQQQTYRQTPHYTGMGRYEQLIDLLDAATPRLESRCEEIDRRVKICKRQKQRMGGSPMRISIRDRLGVVQQPYASPGAYRPLQPLPLTAPTLAANPHPQAGVPISMKKEGKLLDDVSSPPAVFSPSCNPNISGKEESLLEDGVARERKTVDEEKSTVIMKETILLSGDENGLMEEAVNCLHEVSYPSIMVYALTCAGGSEITREVADREKDDIIKMITLVLLCAFDPGIYVRFSTRHCEFLAMQMAKIDIRDEN